VVGVEAKLGRWCQAEGATCERIRRRWQILRKYFEVQGEVQSGRERIGVKHHSVRFDSVVHFYEMFCSIPQQNISKYLCLEPFQLILPRIRTVSPI
jgi:hypothetical protein